MSWSKKYGPGTHQNVVRGPEVKTMKERLRHAITTSDARELGLIVDLLRLRGLDYADMFDMAKRAVPGLEVREWDGLLYDVDEIC